MSTGTSSSRFSPPLPPLRLSPERHRQHRFLRLRSFSANLPRRRRRLGRAVRAERAPPPRKHAASRRRFEPRARAPLPRRVILSAPSPAPSRAPSRAPLAVVRRVSRVRRRRWRRCVVRRIERVFDGAFARSTAARVRESSRQRLRVRPGPLHPERLADASHLLVLNPGRGRREVSRAVRTGGDAVFVRGRTTRPR